MKGERILSKEQLIERAFRFYSRYGKEVDQIKDLLEIKLKQICLAYTIENNLSTEALIVKARTKSLDSFLKK